MGSISVVGVDGADYELLKRWDCSNLILENHRQMETASFTFEVPHTMEVWPCIATGVPPKEHGVYAAVSNRKNVSQIYKFAAFVNRQFPEPIKQRIMGLKRRSVGNEFPTTEHPHLFEKGAVTN